LLFLGSSCIYPKLAPQPLKEEYLLTGPLEETNEPYALAKIAGLKLVQAYRRQHGLRWISAMPTNLYGPGDNFSPEGSHVLPALIRRFYEAKLSGAPTVTVWGSGKPLREFLHVDDLASACLLLLDKYDDDVAVNVGSGKEISISELAKLISEVIGYRGEIEFDSSKPDGTPRKLLENSRLAALGWAPEVSLREGIETTYEWFLSKEVSV
jgi:GDP-L-fucose synthase